MIDFASFSDELQKIAESKDKAIYSAGVVAHEAGHAQTQKGELWRKIRRYLPGAANLYGAGRLASEMGGASGMGYGEFGAVAAVQDLPVLADEAAASVIGMSRSKKQFGKKDWRRAALQLAALQSSYASSPLVNLATVGAAKAGLHPLGQLGLQLLAKPTLSRALGAAGIASTDGPKVDARGAKKIVEAVAPKGTPVIITEKPFVGGSAYVPPSDNDMERAVVAGTFAPTMSKRDLSTLTHKGGVLLAPLDAKTQLMGASDPITFKRLR